MACFEGKDEADDSEGYKPRCEEDQDYAALVEKDMTHKVLEVVPKPSEH